MSATQAMTETPAATPAAPVPPADGAAAPPAGGASPPADGAAPAAPQDVKPPVKGQTTAEWIETIEDVDLRAYAKGKQWKSPEEVLRGYSNLEKLARGDEKTIIRLPKDENDVEAREALHKALGRPDKPEEYELALPEGGDPEFAKAAAELFHKRGIPKDTAKELAEFYNTAVTRQAEAAEAAFQARSQAEEAQLRSEWGQAFEQNREIGRRATDHYGMDAAALSALEAAKGTKWLYEFMHKLGKPLLEDTFVTGEGSTSFVLAPAEAQARIAQLRADPEWSKNYLEGKTKEVQEMGRLMKQAYPGG